MKVVRGPSPASRRRLCCDARGMAGAAPERIRQWRQCVISWSLRHVAIASLSLIRCVIEVRRECCVRFAEV
jgi:hypothetical protein